MKKKSIYPGCSLEVYVKCIVLENRYLSFLINKRYHSTLKFHLKTEFGQQKSNRRATTWSRPRPSVSVHFQRCEATTCENGENGKKKRGEDGEECGEQEDRCDED